MLKQIEDLIECVYDSKREGIDCPDASVLLKFLWILEQVEKETGLEDAHVYTCGKEAIMEWHSKDWANDRENRAILSAMVSPNDKFICSYAGKENELHEYDKPERIVEQIVDYLKRDIFQG